MNRIADGNNGARRRLQDRFAQWIISAGGVGVLLSALTILLYLVYEVVPLFKAAELDSEGASIPLVTETAPLLMTVEERGEVALVVQRNGRALFFALHDGSILRSSTLDVQPPITAIARDSAPGKLFAVAAGDGNIAVYRRGYRITYPDGSEVVTPRLDREYSIPVPVADGEQVRALAISENRGRLMVAAEAVSGRLSVISAPRTDASTLTEVVIELPDPGEPAYLFIESNQQLLVRIDTSGQYQLIAIQAGTDQAPTVIERGRLFSAGEKPVAFATLQGGHAFVVSGSDGDIVQFSPAVDGTGSATLVRMRHFSLDGAVADHLAEDPSGRAFTALGDDGTVALFHTTSDQRLLSGRLALPGEAVRVAMSSEGRVLAVLGSEQASVHWRIDVSHPEVSAGALFLPVLYEGYTLPLHKWQSASASDDYEAKLGLSPLLFGTLKAAFYTMLFAVPVAISAAIFTGYFMAPGLRRPVKPAIELLEAMPTVVLGFLAGLWLAPLVEQHLAGVVLGTLLLPALVLLTGALWGFLPPALRRLLPSGWEPLLLVPVIIAGCLLAAALGQMIEANYLGVPASVWVEQRWGLDYSQRNALVVGIAMGLAVIPSIFSIAEDAVFSVPRHLSDGSLALGASKWQTLRNVVLPAASPGIFSALVIGLGRAVGETMIVLMATGNTPLMESNLFSGMRTLSANIAVEIPEVAAGSTHYRVLIVSALLLFVLTFVLNTLAELLRQRLRRQYGAL